MSSKLKLILFLTTIILVGMALRTWKLADLPNGLTWDEAGLGYNAYSILKTGRDEHGTRLPLVFKSFGDYKPGAYVYFALPFIAALDLTEFSTRLPSAVSGVLALVGIYLLGAQLFKSKTVGVMAATVLALSPWHIFYSRGAWEVNLFVTLLVFGLYFLLKVYEDNWPLWPALLLAVLTLYTYQAAKMLTPLAYGLIVLYYAQKSWAWRKDRKFLRRNLVALILFGLALVFTGWQNISGTAGNRLTRLSIFNYRPGIAVEDRQIDGDFLAGVFHSQPEQTLRLIASRYLYHFSPEVLFYEGPVVTDRGHIPRLGMMYLVEVVFLLAGLAVAARKHKLLLWLLLLAPLPASLTLAEFSTTRSLFLVIPLALLVSLGIEQLYRRFGKLLLPLLLLYAANVVYGQDLYFFHSTRVWAFEFNYGHKQAVAAIQRYPDSDVVFTDLYGQPYIYYLFYAKYPPEKYQAQNRFVDGGVDVGHVGRIDNIEFRQFSLQDIRLSKNMLFIGSPINLPDEFLPQIDNIAYYEQVAVEAHKPLFRIIKTE